MKTTLGTLKEMISSLILAFVIVPAPLVFAPPASAATNTSAYSSGFRMGLLTKFSFKGIAFKSYEGELLLGSNSSREDGINPWSFSVPASSTNLVKELKSAVGRHVIIRYETALTDISLSSAYRVVEVAPVANSETPETCQNQAPIIGAYSKGERMGRIVKLSYKGFTAKSWELVIQMGNSGNQFHAMTVLDDNMALCLMAFMATGRRAVIEYNQAVFHNPFTRDSGYQVLQVKPVVSQLKN